MEQSWVLQEKMSDNISIINRRRQIIKQILIFRRNYTKKFHRSIPNLFRNEKVMYFIVFVKEAKNLIHLFLLKMIPFIIKSFLLIQFLYLHSYDIYNFLKNCFCQKQLIECTLRADLGHMNNLRLEKTDIILMTDIKSSSKLLMNHEDSMWKCLRLHFSDADKHLETEDGVLIDTEGDSCICLFKTLQSAVNFGNKFIKSSENYIVAKNEKIDLRCVIHAGSLNFKQLHNYIYCFGKTKEEAYRMLEIADINEITICDTILENNSDIKSDVKIVKIPIDEIVL